MNKQTLLTTIGIIVIIALITLGIYYSQNITPKTNSLLPVANQTDDTLQNEQGLQDQIDDLISQLNQLNSSDQDNDVVPFGYIAYANDQYGFSFNYKKPISPARLIISDPADSRTDYVFIATVGVPDTGSGDSFVRIWREKDINKVINAVEIPLIQWLGTREGYSAESLNLNNIEWTVFKYHGEYADANHEHRIGQLPNGYVIGIESMGWFKSQPDQTFLNSLKAI